MRKPCARRSSRKPGPTTGYTFARLRTNRTERPNIPWLGRRWASRFGGSLCEVNVFPCSVLVRPRQCSYKLPPSEALMPFNIGRLTVGGGLLISALLLLSGCGDGVDAVRKAAEQGNAQAQSNLGVMYQDGEGVPQSDTEAVKWYRKSAEQGNAYGQYNLGWMYQMGKGVPQSDTEAVKWYRKSAEQGFTLVQSNVQSNLGMMYATGRGVPQSDTEAVAWYRKAAEQGNAYGQHNLGWMYANGRGVSQDIVKAYMWGSLAVLNGQSKADPLRDAVAKDLTPSQLSQAQAMAQQCQASNYKNCD